MSVVKPIHRGRLRQILGKKYFRMKRKLRWMKGGNWSRQIEYEMNGYPVFKHQSMILRPLKDVDMYLQENKRTNLKLAVEKLHLTQLKPGETMSFWKQVGKPSKSKGYLEGLVLNQGKIDRDTGGGLCQLGNLLFWITAQSPLSVIERHRHGFDVFPDVNRKVPFGAGATLSYNYIDLQIKNETENTFQFKLWLDETHLHGELLSKDQLHSSFEVIEENHRMDQQNWGGYTRHNQIFKVERFEDGSEDKSLLVENHAIMMYSPFLHA